MARWPLHPPPLDDELLSSWLTRLATGYEMEPDTFCQHVLDLPQQSLSSIDTDPPAGLLATLADHTGWSISRVEATTLRRYEGILFETLDQPDTQTTSSGLPRFHPDWRRGDEVIREPRKGQHLTPWLLPREPVAAVPFCPRCLSDGPVIYPRTAWHLALSVVCRRHEGVLWDHCPACAKPVWRCWVNGTPPGWERCWCGVALAQAPTVRAPESVLWLADRFHEALTTGRVLFDGLSSMSARCYFVTVRAFVECIRLRRVGQSWAESCWRHQGIDPVGMCHQLATPFEGQPLPWRLRILDLVGTLLMQWPHGFLASCQRVSLNVPTLLARVQGLPVAMLEPLLEVLGAQDPPTVTHFLMATRGEASGLWEDLHGWAQRYLSACRRAGMSTRTIQSRSFSFPQPFYEALDDVLFDERVERAVARALDRARRRWRQGLP